MKRMNNDNRILRIATFAVCLLTASASGVIFAQAETPAKSVFEAESRRIAVIERAKRAVVAVFDSAGSGGGSGVVISPDGFALTNFHVVQPCGAAMRCGMADGRVSDAVIVGIDPTGDVALIRLLGRDDFPVAQIGDSDSVRVGDEALAMGNPFLLATNLQPTVTLGLISGVHRYQYPSGSLLEYADCLQTDASVNPGNSGGPLFDAEGRLIGINGRCSFEKRGRVNVGVAYAISINQIKMFLGALKSGRLVDHALIGFRVAASDDGRITVTDIEETSDAYRRGVRLDDEIISLAGRAVTSPNVFKNILGTLPESWRVPLVYRRKGERRDVFVRLENLHSSAYELADLMGGKDGGEPKPDSPEPKKAASPKEKEKTPKKNQLKGKQGVEKPALPGVVQKLYEEKRGYANYYYNRLAQDRVEKAFAAQWNLNGSHSAWIFSGVLPNGAAYNLDLTDDGVTFKQPSKTDSWKPASSPDANLNADLAPSQSGGLYLSLYLWRRLAVEGFKNFGDVWYFGTAPLPDMKGEADVLVGVHRGVETRFYFDPRDGRLVLVEMFPDDYVDPCELRFSQYREENGRQVPGRIEIRHGDETFGALNVTGFSLNEEKKKP